MMNQTIKCLAIDDEQLALDLIADNISKVPFLELLHVCNNPFDAIKILEEESIDLIFLDIQMPGMTGLQLIKLISEKKINIILVTAYDNYALEGYEMNVVDYLLKPVSFDRFYQACSKVKDIFDLKQSNEINHSNNQVNSFFVNSEYSLIKVYANDILYIEGMKDYIKIYLLSQPKALITRMSFKMIEEKLPQVGFFRVHKSYLVNIDRINSIRNNFVFINKQAIPFSEKVKDELYELLNIK